MTHTFGIYKVSTGHHIDITKLLCVSLQAYGDIVNGKQAIFGVEVQLTFQLQDEPMKIWQETYAEAKQVRDEILEVWEEFKRVNP